MHAPNNALRKSIMVVDDPRTATILRKLTDNIDIIQSDSYLHVLGQMPKNNVRVVVGSIQAMQHELESTVRSLRTLAPDAILIALTHPSHEQDAMRAVRLGMDHYLIAPVTQEQLEKVIASELSNDDSDENTNIKTIDSAPNATPPHLNSPTPQHTTQQHNLEPHTSDPITPTDPAEDPNSQPTLIQTSGLPLGDIDLVEHLLHKHNNLSEVALQVIRQQTNDDTIQWQEQVTDHTGCSAAIYYANRDMGFLTSNITDQPTLAGYAQWLSRWLTLENQLHNLNQQAFTDPLTNIWNRRYFDRRLNSLLNNAKQQRFQVTVMLFDIDNFKQFNDSFGHPVGDTILREAAALMQSMARKDDIVARIGGDEFAVIFWDAEAPRQGQDHGRHPTSVVSITQRYREAICQKEFPSLANAPATITISGGLASFPWDGQNATQLINVADQMLLQSKKQGKNAITFGPGARKACGLDQ